MSIYLPTANNYYSPGTRVKASHEGRITKGTLEQANADKNIIQLKDGAGKLHWFHERLVTLDR